MGYQVLARRLRPTTFQEVVGQNHITRSLQNALKTDSLAHAYLFSGTRGIGKTTVARIFAKSICCLNRREDGNPCGECETCQDFDTTSSMDVLEIDGASNNSVDNIRDLIDNVQYLPSLGTKKVYIIDEVHMLTTNAFNALLKTLEEPPAHVTFLFATTEPEKLLETVLSRCVRLDFKNASQADLVSHVTQICEKEGIHFEDNSLIERFCEQGNGSFRDTLTLLDQVISLSGPGVITEEIMSSSLGLVRRSTLKSLATALIASDSVGVRNIYRSILAQNLSVQNVANELSNYFFKLIENLDNLGPYLEKREGLEQLIDEISAAEVFWIYESLVKDLDWILKSFSSQKVYEVLLLKVSMRRQFFGHAGVRLGEISESTVQSQSNIDAGMKAVSAEEEIQLEGAPMEETRGEEIPVESVLMEAHDAIEASDSGQEMEAAPVEVLQSVEEPEVIQGEKTWTGFLAWLFTISPATASNLEQGNIVGEPVLDQDPVTIRLGFTRSAKVFYDFIMDEDIMRKLQVNLRKYFNVEEVKLEAELVSPAEEDFKSIAEIEKEKEEKILEEKRSSLLNHPSVLKAQEMFGGTIDKVVLE